MRNSPIIVLNNLKHKGHQQIGLSFKYNKTLIALVKHQLAANWSTSQQLWYLPNTRNNFKRIEMVIANHAIIDTRDFILSKNDKTSLYVKKIFDFSLKQRQLLNNYFLFLKGKRYSKSTITTYVRFMADFVAFQGDKLIADYQSVDVYKFSEQVLEKKGYAISSHRQFVSALKLFVIYYPDCNIEAPALERPRKSLKLPSVLSIEDILRLLSVTHNLKHRTIIALLYSCGLRVGELVSLRLNALSGERKQLHVKNAKGRKDRYVPIAEHMVPLLSNYIISFQPEFYLFEGRHGAPISPSSIRHFLKRQCEKAGITRRVTPHTLRHSYATHLLENGTDIRYIQTLLGHAKPETTMIYTHVSRKDLQHIENPLDKALNQFKNRRSFLTT